MSEPEEQRELSPFAQRAIEGMRAAVRAKWYEAAMGFFFRAVTNYQTGEACREAGFTDAALHFANRCAYYLAQGLYCLAQVESPK